MGAVLLRVMEGHTLFQVFISKYQLSQIEQGNSKATVGPQKERLVLLSLSQRIKNNARTRPWSGKSRGVAHTCWHNSRARAKACSTSTTA
jgi:hypothetical protein